MLTICVSNNCGIVAASAKIRNVYHTFDIVTEFLTVFRKRSFGHLVE
jgi:hypothetical protein